MLNSPIKIWRRQKEIRAKIHKIGKIISWTIIEVGGEKFKSYTPMVIVLVELENKEKIFGELVDYTSKKTIKIGKKVISVIRRVGKVEPEEVVSYGLKFKFVENK